MIVWFHKISRPMRKAANRLACLDSLEAEFSRGEMSTIATAMARSWFWVYMHRPRIRYRFRRVVRRAE